MRLYDAALAAEISKKQYTADVDGVSILFKPIPDDAREHVLDPRLLQIIEKKKVMFTQRKKAGYSLSGERYRPDKVTYDLTESDILCTEQLIPIGGDHLIDIFIYRPANAQELLPVLVYLHGGGFTAGDMRLFANQMKLISEKAHAVVVFPEYRLAPECPFPGPIDDACGTIDWVVAHGAEIGADVSRLMVAGDSAGGSLTSACVLKDTRHAIKRIFEIYPGADMSDYRTQTRFSWSYDAYPVIEAHKELAYSRIDRIKNNHDSCSAEHSLYLQGKTTAQDPLVSVVYASDEQLRQFPPMTVAAAEYDYLRVGSDYLVKRMQGLGISVRSIRYCGCDHGFLDMLGTVVQAEDLCAEVAAALRAL